MSETKQELCRCQRYKKPQHCPACGTTTVYAKDWNSRRVKLEPEVAVGEAITVVLMGFRCRRCGLDFDEGMQCEAPRFENKSMRERREMDEKEAKLAELLKQHGGREALLKKLFAKEETK